MARPLGLRPVAVEFDAVLVGIAQIERLADAVVAGAVELDAGGQHAMQRIGQRGTVGIEDSGVKQAGRAGRRWMAALAFPGIEPDVVMIAAGGNESRLIAVALHDLKAEYAAIKAERAVEISDLQMNMPDTRAGDDGVWIGLHFTS